MPETRIRRIGNTEFQVHSFKQGEQATSVPEKMDALYIDTSLFGVQTVIDINELINKSEGHPQTGALVRDHTGEDIVIICPSRIILALQANFETFVSEREFVRFWLEKKNGHCAVTFYTNPHVGKRNKERLKMEFRNRCFWSES